MSSLGKFPPEQRNHLDLLMLTLRAGWHVICLNQSIVKAGSPGESLMRGPQIVRILAGTALSLIFAAPRTALVQDLNEPPAMFNERFPSDQTSAQPSFDIQEATKDQKITTTTRTVRVKRATTETRIATETRTVGAKRARSRVVVVPRSFLDAGTEVLPGERKFLDYAFSPTHVALGIVTNTGGRVGWHNSPLPGPFFPRSN
jgi:hypothetical protein